MTYPIAALHQILANKKATGDDFRVIFILFFMRTILSLTSSVYIPSKDLSQVQSAKSIRGKKWATWTFNHLCERIQKYRTYNPQYICGCLLVLQLFYIDIAWVGKYLVSRNLSVVYAWGKKETKKFKKLLKTLRSQSAKPADEAEQVGDQFSRGSIIDLTVKIPLDTQSTIDASHKITFLTQ